MRMRFTYGLLRDLDVSPLVRNHYYRLQVYVNAILTRNLGWLKLTVLLITPLSCAVSLM
jgi:hypothetical protein